MESLDPKEREKLKKLPDARLTGYLVKAGISLEELETMDRTAMLERWAKFVAAGVTGGAAGGATQVPVAVDVNLERERLAFEKAKFDAQLQFERQKAEAQLALERERLAAQLASERDKLHAWRPRKKQKLLNWRPRKKLKLLNWLYNWLLKKKLKPHNWL